MFLQSHCSLEQPDTWYLIRNFPCHNITIFSMVIWRITRHISTHAYISLRKIYIKIWEPHEYLHKPNIARVHTEHFCCWQYGSTFITFNAIAFKKSMQKLQMYLRKKEFNVKWPFTVIQGHVFCSHWKSDKGLNNITLCSEKKTPTLVFCYISLENV